MRFARAKTGRPCGGLKSSGDSVVEAPEDQTEGDKGDEDFAEDADYERTPTLAYEFLEVGAEADAGEGWKECPARQIRDVISS